MAKRRPYVMQFDIGTIKHLGLQMYSTLPPVIAELVSNAWDADAEVVDITIPTTAFTQGSEILVVDDGCGMNDSDIRKAYLVIGRDRRKDQGDKPTPTHKRRLMGRKGIGKLSAFGIAEEIEVETAKHGEIGHFRINYHDIEKAKNRRQIKMPPLPVSGRVRKGTRITLHGFKKYENRKVSIQDVRRRLARRFSILGPAYSFSVRVNGTEITPEERDLKRLLDKDAGGQPYLWTYDGVEIRPDTGWRVSGWIGALKRTDNSDDGVQRGITILARGKLVQDPFVFEATVGQQYALSYLVGELHAEFVDEKEDSISTTRNSLVWDTDANNALLEWGKKEVNTIARAWAEKRSRDNEEELKKNALYLKFVEESTGFEDSRVRKAAEKLIKSVIIANPVKGAKEQEPVIQYCIDFVQFDAFQELAMEIADAKDDVDPAVLVDLFRDWELIEAKEMMRVTKGRITTIEKLQHLIDKNALEVPTLHNFLKEFPWVLDPRWALIADERRYSQILRQQFPESKDTPEEDKRIDFLCVNESSHLIVVEIKRPKSKASVKQLEQIEEYVSFMRNYVAKTTDPALKAGRPVGYLLCGDLVDTWQVEGKRDNLQRAEIYVRRYRDLLGLVHNNHKEFLRKYDQLRALSRKRKLGG
jgi:hypothetical protein